MNRFMSPLAAGTLLAASLVLLAHALAAFPMWLYGTGTATAHDKQLAHELALDDAKRNAEKAPGCDGPYGGPIETKVSYARDEATGEWRATVSIRESCLAEGSDRM
jgi:hypothetical protein